MLSVTPLTSEQDLENCWPAWRSLLECSFRPRFQHAPEVIGLWLKQLSDSWQPLVLLVRDQERVLGIMPLMFRNERRRGLVPCRRIQFLAHSMKDFEAVLASDEAIGPVVHAALEWLFSGKMRWELMILDDLPDDNPATAAIAKTLAGLPCAVTTRTGEYCYIPLRREWEDVWNETSQAFVRRYVNQARNRLNRLGSWSFVARPSLSAAEIIQRVAPIHISRQEQKKRPSVFSTEAGRAYVSGLLQHSIVSGTLSTYWLECDRRWAAYIIGFEEADVFYFWNTAFEPEFASFHPGRFLLFEVIKDCHARGLVEFNFMRGLSAYKQKWTPHSHANRSYRVISRKTWLGKALAFWEKRCENV